MSKHNKQTTSKKKNMRVSQALTKKKYRTNDHTRQTTCKVDDNDIYFTHRRLKDTKLKSVGYYLCL